MELGQQDSKYEFILLVVASGQKYLVQISWTLTVAIGSVKEGKLV